MSLINVKNNIDLRKNINREKSFYFFYPLNNVTKKIFSNAWKNKKKYFF